MDIDVMTDVAGIPGFREPVNCFSHLGGAAIFAVLSVFLVRRGRGSRSRILSLAVMGFSAVLLLALSGVYHMLDFGTAREVMKHLDVAGVFVLIAGTITPIHTILFTGLARWGALVLVWLPSQRLFVRQSTVAAKTCCHVSTILTLVRCRNNFVAVSN